ncbi:MAG: hypothetical protein A3F72_19815 [Bacteroidetes bacterium RIFCSPLOWO2_12_FULL_35_15]|nr:MAG: hypothetical protein A3F72_19815 [Bacteroidetes bacterium RIFCSPLOWO2_12_FULL_35_15]
MKEMGFDDFSFEPIRVKEDQINAGNEYYYLVAASIISPSLIIRSDTNIFTEAADYNKFNFYGLQEFTGMITLTETDPVNFPIDYEFIRVVPRVALIEEKQKVVYHYLQNIEKINNAK